MLGLREVQTLLPGTMQAVLQEGEAMKILVDCAEKEPLSFEHPVRHVKFPPPEDTGDYSIEGMEQLLRIERKKMPELWSCVGSRQDHFRSQLERMRRFRYPVLLIEGTPVELARSKPPNSRMSWEQVSYRTMAWTMEFGVPVWFMGQRSRESCRMIEDLMVAAHQHHLKTRHWRERWEKLWKE